MSQHIYTYDPATGELDEIAGGGNTNFVGTTAEWEALSSAEKAQYVTVDLTDDFDGASIDPVPTEDSANAVSSGGVYSSIQTLTNQANNKVLYLTGIACSALTGYFTEYSNAAITPSHVLAECVFANPSAITSDVQWNTDTTGVIKLQGTCTTATTVNLVLIKKDN